MRSRMWKHKEGRGTSHSYWSRTHGPRGTTHGTSGRHRNANYAAKKGRAQKQWAARQGKLTKIHLHLLRIIHLGISIQNISLVLSCESHPKCKLKATDNCIIRTLRKVNNPCTPGYN